MDRIRASTLISGKAHPKEIALIMRVGMNLNRTSGPLYTTMVLFYDSSLLLFCRAFPLAHFETLIIAANRMNQTLFNKFLNKN